ncbi:MAG: 16S rRNA (cytosine(1402)-N(4))-methyltransferase RsmH [Clostridia bacterium]|nr:16S rRNA (cytosine(1402)-N(4))-methyltransferase RsmH [Clostridia bacterium]
MPFEHVSVMLEETVSLLNVRPGGVYVDGTLGGGGHSAEILKRLNGTGHLYGIDRDMDALEAARERLGDGANFTAIHGNFHDAVSLLEAEGITQADGFLMDLGVSSYQLDTAERGFSYHVDAPLDMRMDQSAPLSAETIVNTWSVQELTRILRDYGEEKWAARIAAIIAEHRAKAPLKTTGDLVACVDAAIPRAVRNRDNGHSARRTFQALRIAVNDELDPLRTVLMEMARFLKPGGRIVVLTFHSLEDRIVKQTFREMANPCQCPPGFPVCVCGRTPQVSVLEHQKPSHEEIERNSRSHSAMLRGCERLDTVWNLEIPGGRR